MIRKCDLCGANRFWVLKHSCLETFFVSVAFGHDVKTKVKAKTPEEAAALASFHVYGSNELDVRDSKGQVSYWRTCAEKDGKVKAQLRL